MAEQPDAAVLARLYGPEAGAIQIALRALYARRDQLDVLIALMESEMAFSKIGLTVQS